MVHGHLVDYEMEVLAVYTPCLALAGSQALQVDDDELDLSGCCLH